MKTKAMGKQISSFGIGQEISRSEGKCDDCGQDKGCRYFPSPFPEDDEDCVLCERCYEEAERVTIRLVEKRLSEMPFLRQWLRKHKYREVDGG